MRQMATAESPDASAARDPAPIDLAHLSRHTLGDRDLAREVLLLFARQAELLMGRIDAQDAAADLADTVHTISGSARGIGAWKVSAAAEVAEAALRSGEPADLSPLRAAIEEARFFIDGLA